MNYAESLDYIMNIPHFAKTNTLERIGAILSALDHPERKLRFLHVAGTNGKGSTVTMLSAVLRANGQRVGTFVSPFVYDFLERIQIDCRPVAPAVFAAALTRVRAVADALPERANFFEILTAAALLIFHEARCEVVVLEVGLGGRLDATNIIPAPQLAIITSLGLDHTAYLGETLPEIAAEKCGIIKPGCTVITGAAHPPEVRAVIERACRAAGAPLLTAQEDFSVLDESIAGARISWRGISFLLPLAGRHQRKNLALVLRAAEALAIPPETVARGLEAVQFPARLQIVCHAPLTLVDGAHNPDGMRALCDAVRTLLPGRRITTIFGCLRDKNMREMAQLAAQCSDTLILTPPPSPRAASPEELLAFCRGIPARDFEDAYRIARAQPELDVLLVCGSLYLAGASRPAHEAQ